MRVGILSYPMLFQRDGGLQVQVRETVAAMNRLSLFPNMLPVGTGPRGVQVRLVDANHDRLDDYDLIHVFSAINGNVRIVEAACELGVPVVLSPLISPGWTRSAGLRAQLADRLAGRMTDWMVQTSYAQTKRALQLASLVIALGERERDAIVHGFGTVRDKIRVFPNGINPHFFSANGDLFAREIGLRQPFVLMVGAISPYKNQLGLAQALACDAGQDIPLVLVGAAAREQEPYLQQLQAMPHVRWLGALEHADPLLASAYHAASVLALPSQGEVFPLAVLEALAAGTPVVMSQQSALQLPDAGFALRQVRWDDGAGLRAAIMGLLAQPPARSRVQALVRQFSWDNVAAQIAQAYLQVHAGAVRLHYGGALRDTDSMPA
ncbi:glycosyltransferase [Janthinobacterium aquaticum]|uniref:glycosyltransferase n=1 Tax=Janthinobacterium sp. FT58W TaxID=2654254 RepID=UPI0012658091|nr:glycosyltransferase [Janthinobacterium sp. FT58W]KAB8041584.1 glycosyltransferase [Janthinobacterium sp. FT58W]